ERRLHCADACSSIDIASRLLCGYLGMVKRIAHSAPVQGRAYERRNLRLPFSLESALERMEQCRVIQEVLGEKFCRGSIAVKRVENENYKRVISSWEREFLLLTV